MKPMGSCDGTSEYLGVCDATDGFVRCDDAGEVVQSKLFLGHFERHRRTVSARLARGGGFHLPQTGPR